MITPRFFTFVAAAAAMLAVAFDGPAFAQSGQQKVESGETGRVESGILECAMTNRTNLVIVTRTSFACTFQRSGEDESYTGEITAVGVNLQITSAEKLIWAVLAPRDINADTGALAGRYVGASASAALGVGGAARVLVGGLENSIALQPISVSGQRGVGAALGVEGLNLQLAE